MQQLANIKKKTPNLLSRNSARVRWVVTLWWCLLCCIPHPNASPFCNSKCRLRAFFLCFLLLWRSWHIARDATTVDTFPCREDDDEETPGQVRRSVSIQVSERSDALALSTLSRAREVWFPVWSLGLGWSFWTCKILSFEVLSGDCKKVHSNSGSKIEWSFRDFPVQSLSSYLR